MLELSYASSGRVNWYSHLRKQAVSTRPEGFPGGSVVKNSPCQCRRHKRCRFNPWVKKIPSRGTWQLTPVFLPGKFHGQRSLAGYSPWGGKESDTAEGLSLHTQELGRCTPYGPAIVLLFIPLAEVFIKGLAHS